MIEDHRQLVRDALPEGFGVDIGCRKASCKIGTFGIDRYPGPGVDMICQGNDLPFPIDHFDYVSACHVLEHIPNPKLTLVEWARVLKPAGCLLIVVPNAEKSLRQGVSYWEHVSWFTPDILKTLVQSWLGFQIYHFETREDLKDGPMIFCYSKKPTSFVTPRLPE